MNAGRKINVKVNFNEDHMGNHEKTQTRAQILYPDKKGYGKILPQAYGRKICDGST